MVLPQVVLVDKQTLIIINKKNKTMKHNSILAIILGLGLIGFSAYTINNYGKDPVNSTTSKIIVDILGAIFIIGAIGAVWTAGKALTA